MTDAQLKAIYKTACEGKNYTPNEGQYKIWKQILGWAEEADLAQALVYYFTDNVSFPMPAELKPLVERARLARVAKASEKKYLVRFQCPTYRGHTATGSLTPTDDLPRVCRGIPREGSGICGEIMQIAYDERPVSAA